MTRWQGSIPTEVFDEIYTADPDPWCFASSAYEQAKYQATLAAFPRAHYARGFEIGCSIGVLTRLVASRCGALTAVDASEVPLAAARRRCADRRHVHIARMRIPDQWPPGRFDLILLSEILYFLDAADVVATAARVAEALDQTGHVVLTHCVGSTVHYFSGDDATELFIAQADGFARLVRQERTPRYRIDVLERR